jgi:hypothetical protein
MKYRKTMLFLSLTALLFTTSCSKDSSSAANSPHGDFSSFKEKFQKQYPEGYVLPEGNYICNSVYIHMQEGSIVEKTEKWAAGTFSFQNKNDLAASCTAIHLHTEEYDRKTIVCTNRYFTGSSFYMNIDTVDWENGTYSYGYDRNYGIDHAVLEGVDFNIETYYNDFNFVDDPSVTFYAVSSYVFEISTLVEKEEKRIKTGYAYYFNSDLSIRKIRKTIDKDDLLKDESESYLWIFEPDEEELNITIPDDYLENPYDTNRIGTFSI